MAELESIPTSLRNLAKVLAAKTGKPFVLDPRMANPPCGIVQLDSWDQLTLCGTDADAKAVVYLVAPDNGVEEALITLVEMAAELPAEVKRTATSDMVPVGGTAPLPALRLGPFDLGDYLEEED